MPKSEIATSKPTPSVERRVCRESWKAFRGNGKKYKDSAKISEQKVISVQPDLRRNRKKDIVHTFKIIQDALSKDPRLSILKSCKIYGASRSGYYKWIKRPEPTPFAMGLSVDVKDQIQGIVLKFPEYGYRRVTMELRSRGYVLTTNEYWELWEIYIQRRHNVGKHWVFLKIHE